MDFGITAVTTYCFYSVRDQIFTLLVLTNQQPKVTDVYNQ